MDTMLPSRLLQVSCGQTFTLAFSEDGDVFGFGKADNCVFGTLSITGEHYQPRVSWTNRPPHIFDVINFFISF